MPIFLKNIKNFKCMCKKLLGGFQVAEPPPRFFLNPTVLLFVIQSNIEFKSFTWRPEFAVLSYVTDKRALWSIT